MNWLQKQAQRSGYLIPELIGTRYSRWEEREAELSKIRDEARKTAEKLLVQKGHRFGSWDAVNQTYCLQCNKQLSLRNVHSSGGATLHGPASEEGCSPYSGVYNMPDYRVTGWKW